MTLLSLVYASLLFCSFGTINAQLDLYGHRGGVLGLLPEHSTASYSMGAQHGASYIEPDLVVTKDGELVVLHDLEVSLTTDVASKPEFVDRYRTVTNIWKRGNPENYTHGQPKGLVNRYQNESGWFSFDFTLAELKTLKKFSRAYPEQSPFNGLWEVLTFNESLKLINNLSLTFDRHIAVIPESKNAAWLKHVGFTDFEHKILASLEAYGFMYRDEAGFYKPFYHYDATTGTNKSAVILQSFTAESLFTLNTLTNGSLPTMFLMEKYDEYTADTVQWIASFADIIACPKSHVAELVNAAAGTAASSLRIAAFDLLDDIDEYIGFIRDGLIGVFSDDVGTGRVVNDVFNDGTFCQHDCNSLGGNNERMKYALIGAGIMFAAISVLGLILFFCNNRIWRVSKLKREFEMLK